MKKLLCIILSILSLCFSFGCNDGGGELPAHRDFSIHVGVFKAPLNYTGSSGPAVKVIDGGSRTTEYILSLQAECYVLSVSGTEDYRPVIIWGDLFRYDSDAIKIEEYLVDGLYPTGKYYLYGLKECEKVEIVAKTRWSDSTWTLIVSFVDQPQIYIDAEVYNKVNTFEQDLLTENDRLYNSFADQGQTLNLSLDAPYYLIRVQYKDDCEVSIINVDQLDLQFDDQAMRLEIIDYIGERFLFLKGSQACQESPITISYKNPSSVTYTTTFNVSFS